MHKVKRGRMQTHFYVVRPTRPTSTAPESSTRRSRCAPLSLPRSGWGNPSWSFSLLGRHKIKTFTHGAKPLVLFFVRVDKNKPPLSWALHKFTLDHTSLSLYMNLQIWIWWLKHLLAYQTKWTQLGSRTPKLSPWPWVSFIVLKAQFWPFLWSTAWPGLVDWAVWVSQPF